MAFTHHQEELFEITFMDNLAGFNLIAYNKANGYGGGLLAYKSFSTLLNNIIWGNEAKRGDQLFQGEGLPFIDHSVVQNYGKGTNVLAKKGDNIHTKEPFLELSQEPITP